VVFVHSGHYVPLVVWDKSVKNAGFVVAGLPNHPGQLGMLIEETLSVCEFVEEEIPIGLSVVIR
jgi:hypothetical protein